MHIPAKCLLIVRKLVWSQCAYVPKYEVVRGPADYDVKTSQTPSEDEVVTLLKPDESTEADDDEVAADWSEIHCMKVRITNRDGGAAIDIINEGTLARTD